MAIVQMHKKATLVISVCDTSDHWVVCTVYQAGTVNGTRYWFEKKVEDKVVLRRSTLIPATAREWLDTMEESANEGEVEAVELNQPAIDQLMEGRRA